MRARYKQGATTPTEEELPSSLQSLAYYNGMLMRSDPDFHNDINRLIKAI